MADSSRDRASFSNQANALLRKNLTFQKRNIRTNLRLIFLPFYFCLILVLVQNLVNKELDKPKNKCGCTCIDTNGDGQCEKVCGIEYSTLDQASSCSITSPPEWPPLLQIPAPEFRAVRTDFLSFTDLPDESCRISGSCPATILFTGNNQSLGQSLAGNMFRSSSTLNSSDILYSLANDASGSETMTGYSNFLDPAFFSNYSLYRLQQQCPTNSRTSVSIQITSISVPAEIRCAQGLHLWRNNSSEINDELYKGFWKGNSERKIDEMVAAYDFLNSNLNNFNVSIWYNSTYKNDTGNGPLGLMRVPRSVNMVSNAYLQFLLGPATNMLFDFVKEMPQHEKQLRLDFSSLLGPLVFTWVIIQLFPVILTYLVYEKQQKLRIMMKMHGLGDGPYWMISYAYFLVISSAYMLCFVIFGSVVGLKFFTLNEYSIQFVFYFIYINLQISLAFLIASVFSNVKTAAAVAYFIVFGTGLLGSFLFQFFIEDPSFPRGWIVVMELYPGFSLYRGLYEFSQYSFTGNYMGTKGMRWGDISGSSHGMRDILIIMFVEWLLVLFVAFYIDQVVSSGSGVGRSPLFFLEKFRKKPFSSSSMRKPSLRRQGSKVFVQMEKPDVAQEMIGLLKPSSGTAYVEGLDIQTQMDEIYTSMGVCPQHDLLWENLTGREHLLFYGRLKNLRGSALTQAVEESLKSVNLFHGGVADKQAGKYSGGMKRRLSVAISLIGDPKVVYMDEPSTGLDPASRKSLWDVVKQAKQNRAIILTTHSMEEAEHLCDRLGIFVDGSLQCIGNPKELKARYGGSYVFTMTTTSNHEEEVENLVQHLSPNANKIYHLSGTQKFELPKQEVRIADVFQAVENAKGRFTVHAWGLADTTLEDVFIKVARGAQAFNVLS
ncbi:ABC transporter A family member 7-like isoform X3 [Camellia sinensis]|uniref:ABC transporter A family member 7-like isoform X3 n=1 Tax=Camellia sinensis TaxID=4442 RepID=UPI001035A54D|nr:ABC transporter A family member 7-like isoform X3 [Camellia sinensis]